MRDGHALRTAERTYVDAGDLGASFPLDLASLEEEDFVELGMKKLEVQRLRRVMQEVS